MSLPASIRRAPSPRAATPEVRRRSSTAPKDNRQRPCFQAGNREKCHLSLVICHWSDFRLDGQMINDKEPVTHSASLDAAQARHTFRVAFLRSWRNWQTHQLEGLPNLS